jgi:hypothetical protein
VLADHPVAYWRMDDRSLPADVLSPQIFEQVAARLTGKRDGTLTPGLAGALPGDDGKALGFDTGYLSFGDRLAFPGTASFTLELWLKVTSMAFGHVVTKQDRGSPKHGYAIYTVNANVFFERYETDQSVAVSMQVGLDVYRHITSIYDGTSMRMYVNGELAGMKPDTRSMSVTVQPFILGTSALGATGDIVHGALDEVAIYDYALPEARIQAHLAAATP